MEEVVAVRCPICKVIDEENTWQLCALPACSANPYHCPKCAPLDPETGIHVSELVCHWCGKKSIARCQICQRALCETHGGYEENCGTRVCNFIFVDPVFPDSVPPDQPRNATPYITEDEIEERARLGDKIKAALSLQAAQRKKRHTDEGGLDETSDEDEPAEDDPAHDLDENFNLIH